MMTLDEWISRFDNEEADKLTQEEQGEVKSMLIELRWRRLLEAEHKETITENKTCPFCGSDNIEVYTHYGESAGIQYGGYYPECTVCGCRLNYYESREEALKAWNERDNHGRK